VRTSVLQSTSSVAVDQGDPRLTGCMSSEYRWRSTWFNLITYEYFGHILRVHDNWHCFLLVYFRVVNVNPQNNNHIFQLINTLQELINDEWNTESSHIQHVTNSWQEIELPNGQLPVPSMICCFWLILGNI
jgi:hypothetical protein